MLEYQIQSLLLGVFCMMSNKFEAAFSSFLDRHEYDDAERALFEIVRASFLAGWRAAGGEAPQAERIFQVLGRPDSAALESIKKY